MIHTQLLVTDPRPPPERKGVLSHGVPNETCHPLHQVFFQLFFSEKKRIHLHIPVSRLSRSRTFFELNYNQRGFTFPVNQKEFQIKTMTDVTIDVNRNHQATHGAFFA